jgi:hypothetical protein
MSLHLERAYLSSELAWLYLERTRLLLYRMWLDVQLLYLEWRIQRLERKR